MITTRRKPAPDDGVAAVEFAIIVPFLLLLVFGILEFGVIFGQQLALSNAARQGARFGAVPDATSLVPTSTCASIAQEVETAATTIGMSGSNVTVTITGGALTGPCSTSDNTTIPCAKSAPGSSITVTASYVSAPIVPFPYPNPVTLSASGQYECEFN